MMFPYFDIKFIRENADVVRDAATKKNLDPKVIDELLDTDEQRRAMIQKLETCACGAEKSGEP